MTKRCEVCNKKLMVFETNLCSCGMDVCIKHSDRIAHKCHMNKKTKLDDPVIAVKIVKI